MKKMKKIQKRRKRKKNKTMINQKLVKKMGMWGIRKEITKLRKKD